LAHPETALPFQGDVFFGLHRSLGVAQGWKLRWPFRPGEFVSPKRPRPLL